MECPVCYDPFSKDVTVPKILSRCGHTICQVCLNNYIKSTSSTCKISCPFCKMQYSVSEILTSPPNYIILNSLNETDNVPSKNKKSLPARTCSMHNTTHMEFFCKADKTYLCGKCLLTGEHYGHDITHVDDEIDVHKKKLIATIKTLEEKSQLIGDNKERFEKCLQEYQELSKQVVVELDEKFNMALNLIVRRRAELVDLFIQSTTSMNEYLKEKVGCLGKAQKGIEDQIHESKDIKRRLTAAGFDLRNLESVQEQTFLQSISDELVAEFELEVRKNKGSFEETMKQIEQIKPTFNQSPFFVFKEELLTDFLDKFAQMTCPNFRSKARFGIEDKLFSKSDKALQGKTSKKLRTDAEDEDKIDLETEDAQERIHIAEKMLNHKVPVKLQQKDLNILSRSSTPASKYSEILKGATLAQDSDEDANTISLIRDPFSEIQIAGTTVCLLGQNDKVMYINDSGDSEILTVEFEYTHPGAKKGYILKNFASCVFFDRNKVVYTGGGPSAETYLLEFKSKKNVAVTVLPSMAYKRCWHGAVYIRPYVYVLGGFDGVNRLKECERIDIHNNPQIGRYLAIAPMNEARSLFGYTVCKDSYIYVAGGVGASKKNVCCDTIERYHVIENKWTTMNVRIPQKFCGLSIVYYEDQDKLKIFGGSDHLKKSSKTIFEFDIKEQKIREAGNMSSRRQLNNKAYKKGDQLYMVGGNNDAEFEVYNISPEGVERERVCTTYSSTIKSDLNNFCSFIV